MNTFTVAVLTFLICMTLLSTTEGRPLRCRCVGKYSGKPISIDNVDSVQTFAAGPHCKHVEIIATVMHKNNKSSKNCLNPSDAWVKSFIEEWNKKLNSIKRQQESKNILVAY